MEIPFGKMKIYIEDYASFELTINDIPCRKIGELKNGEEKTFPVEEWKWEEFPYSEEEWSALFANPEDLFDLEPFGKILYQPIDDFKFMLLANGDLWFVGLSFLNTGNDCPLVLWSIDKLVPFE